MLFPIGGTGVRFMADVTRVLLSTVALVVRTQVMFVSAEVAIWLYMVAGVFIVTKFTNRHYYVIETDKKTDRCACQDG